MLTWKDIIHFCTHGNPKPSQRVEKTDSEWKTILTEEEYTVTRLKGTERPYSGAHCSSYDTGQYNCNCCNTPLFNSTIKFNSGTGWPSFTQPIDVNAVKYLRDTSHGMVRVEILCNTCDAHLGHIFPDGPEPSGLRYCVNSLSMTLDEQKSETEVLHDIVLGGGCFWCTEAVFQKVKGVKQVVSGYSGGTVPGKPTYREVCSGLTGHAEVVQITYNPSQIDLSALLEIFMTTHDPTTLNRQGADVGTEYRSIIFYKNEREKNTITQVINSVQPYYDHKIVTELKAFDRFYEAEPYHQNYYKRNPEQCYCTYVINPKLSKLRQLHADKLTEE